jgi:serine protease Do
MSLATSVPMTMASRGWLPSAAGASAAEARSTKIFGLWNRTGAAHMQALQALLLAIWATTAGADASDADSLEQRSIAAAVETASESIVRIRTVGGIDRIDRQAVVEGPTTGVIVSPKGLIVSSAYNFAQQPTSILVELPGGEQRPARIVGRDDNRMLVLLRINFEDELTAAEAAPVSEIRPGDRAIALGRSVDQKAPIISVGIVSALNRMHGRAIQTDANVSAMNYGGPLIDLQGRVIGVLVPMAPPAPGANEANVTAGTEFYDSGIGFAIPLEHVVGVLERWVDERDLKRGVLGIGLKSGNPHATAPIVTNVWPGSPAAKAGLEAGDRILAVDGVATANQTALRFQTMPRYAGDELTMKVRRRSDDKTEEFDAKLTLAAELPPYRHPFLGILPARNADNEIEPESDPATGDEKKADDAHDQEGDVSGLAIRAVWPESPADEAGIRPGDRLIRFGKEKITTHEDALRAVTAASIEANVAATLNREGKELELEVELTRLPTEILTAAELSADGRESEITEQDLPQLQTLKLPEMKQSASYLRPASGGAAPGLLLWLGDGKPESRERLAADWRRDCARNGLILLLPEPGDPAGWGQDDLEYLGKLLQTAAGRWRIDPRRVVVAGEGKGGQLAYALALRGRNLIRGVVAIDSPLPRATDVPANSPAERLAVLAVESEGTPLSTLIRKDLQKFDAAGYPVTVVTRRSDQRTPGSLDASTRGKIARWIDSLDRL